MKRSIAGQFQYWATLGRTIVGESATWVKVPGVLLADLGLDDLIDGADVMLGDRQLACGQAEPWPEAVPLCAIVTIEWQTSPDVL